MSEETAVLKEKVRALEQDLKDLKKELDELSNAIGDWKVWKRVVFALWACIAAAGTLFAAPIKAFLTNHLH